MPEKKVTKPGRKPAAKAAVAGPLKKDLRLAKKVATISVKLSALSVALAGVQKELEGNSTTQVKKKVSK